MSPNQHTYLKEFARGYNISRRVFFGNKFYFLNSSLVLPSINKYFVGREKELLLAESKLNGFTCYALIFLVLSFFQSDNYCNSLLTNLRKKVEQYVEKAIRNLNQNIKSLIWYADQSFGCNPFSRLFSFSIVFALHFFITIQPLWSWLFCRHYMLLTWNLNVFLNISYIINDYITLYINTLYKNIKHFFYIKLHLIHTKIVISYCRSVCPTKWLSI